MPRLRAPQNPYERYIGVVLGRLHTCDMSQSDLAERIGVTRNTLARYLNNPDIMQMGTIRRINRVLGIRAEDVRQALPMW